MADYVFIVESDPILLQDFVEAENPFDFTVVPFTSSREALSLLQSTIPRGALLDGALEDLEDFRLTAQLLDLGVPTVLWLVEPDHDLREKLEAKGLADQIGTGLTVHEGVTTSESISGMVRQAMDDWQTAE